MTKARTLADNFAADINGITAGTGITGGGTSGTVTITNDMATTIAAKGDLVVGTANDAYSRLAVASTAGFVLTVDSAEATGLKWAAAGSSGPAFRANRTANYSVTQNTWTKINYNEEDFDTDNCYDSATNFRFTPNKAGYYQFNYCGQINNASAGELMTIALYKNGSNYHSPNAVDISSQGYGQVTGNDLVYMNGSSDYVEVYIYSASASGNIGGNATGNVSVFSGVWIRS